VTRWAEFAEVPALLRDLGRSPLVVDGRRVLPPDAFARYEGIGR
jgi:UDPglucose 6-dehydrogenase/GDP-mannose 6-dehydrogenase